MTAQAHTTPEPVSARGARTLPSSLPWLGEIKLPRAVDRTTARAEEDASIGARIAQLSKERGLIQKELAERLAVSTDDLLSSKREARSPGGVKNRRLARRPQAIDAFISKTA